ncbi:MAG: hypothetical protein HKM93_04250 [Desulfobacteraceae bacterium]|nr:hypothetical protein [Desulfobacteraceae bacterium]
MKTNKFAFLISTILITSLLLPLPAVSVDAADKKSRFFDVTLMTPIGNVAREKAGQIIARDLEKIGIGVNLRYMEFATLANHWKSGGANGTLFDDGGFDMLILQTSMFATIDPVGFYRAFASDQFPKSGKNYTRYINPEFDKYAYKALVTVDDQERWNLVQEAEKLIYNDLPTIPLWHPAYFHGVRSDVKFPEYKDPEDWWAYSFRWAKREIKGKTKKDMTLRERTLIYAQPSDLDAFIPGYRASGYSLFATGYTVFDSLIHQTDAPYFRGPKEQRGPQPALAENWDVSIDGKIWTMNLRKKATWHDGTPFTADDVIFTYDLIVNKDALYESEAFIKEVGITWKKIDKYTVEFTSEKYNPLFSSEFLTRHILPKHLFSKVPPQDLMKSDYNTGKKVVGNGPWVFDEYKPAEYLKLKANDNYYGGRPEFDYLIVKFIPQAASAWYALKTGDIDVTNHMYGFSRELDDANSDPNIYAVIDPLTAIQNIQINAEHPILSNIWVRRAISLASNRDVMVKVISNGLGVAAQQHLPPWSPGFAPDLEPMAYDLNEAKKMMVKAGYNYDDVTIKGPK